VSAPWKGLDPARTPQFISYDQAERMLAALLPRAGAWRPEAVAGIARGGIVPATMAATMLGLPLALLRFDRASGAAPWIGPPPSARRLLLVDDGCSTGQTMAGVHTALTGAGHACLTMTVVHDPEVTRFVPDLSHPMSALWRFPWERGEATPAARGPRGAEGRREVAAEAPFVGLDLDGVFLPDIPPADYDADLQAALARRDALAPLPVLPPFEAARAVVITGRPEIDRARTRAWLDRWGHGALALECCPHPPGAAPALVAGHKAQAATRLGCTHFVESDAGQAILIAAAAPHLVVSWWSAGEGRAYVIAASPPG
jgi:adenine/guanine phosphoribosyltransferase-like PRPP-binding protein